MDRVEEPGDDEEVSFAPTPSPEEARARLAALRGKSLDAPSRLVAEEPAAEPVKAQFVAAAESPAALTTEQVSRLLALLGDDTMDTAPYSMRQPVAELRQKSQKAPKAEKPLFKAKKVRITTRIDADVLAAFKATGPGYQTLMNDVLRANMPGS